MSEARELKIQVVKEIKEKIEKSKSFVIVDYRGITVAQDTELRAMMRKSGVEYKVLKNRLVKIALNELGYTQYDEALNGPTAIAFGMDDVVAPAKILVDNAQQFPKLEIKCGMAEKSFIDKNGVKALAALPSKEILVAKLLGTMQAPIAGFARVLKGTLSGLAIALKAIADKQN